MHMKRKWLAIPTALLCGLVLFAAGEDTSLRVTVRDAQLRAKPSYLGTIMARLKYGDIVIKNGDPDKGWGNVTLPSGAAGWINMSAITEFKGELKSGNGNASQTASASDISAAGKGFNENVETTYRSDHALNYTPVNNMGRYHVLTAEEAAAFFQAGGLNDTLEVEK